MPRLVEISYCCVVCEVRLEQARPVVLNGPIFVRFRGESSGVNNRDNEHFQADEQVLDPLLDICSCP